MERSACALSMNCKGADDVNVCQATQAGIEEWRIDYNEVRPHSPSDYRTASQPSFESAQCVLRYSATYSSHTAWWKS